LGGAGGHGHDAVLFDAFADDHRDAQREHGGGECDPFFLKALTEHFAGTEEADAEGGGFALELGCHLVSGKAAEVVEDQGHAVLDRERLEFVVDEVSEFELVEAVTVGCGDAGGAVDAVVVVFALFAAAFGFLLVEGDAAGDALKPGSEVSDFLTGSRLDGEGEESRLGGVFGVVAGFGHGVTL